MKYIQLVLPLAEGKLKYIIERNELVLEAVKEILYIKSSLREISLHEIQFNISNKDVHNLKVNRDNGNTSGTEFWKKQLESETYKNIFLENKSSLLTYINDFLSNYGYNNMNYFELPELPELPSNVNFAQSPLATLIKIEKQKSEMEIDVNKKKYAGNLTVEFKMIPQYGIKETSSNFINSFDFVNDKSYVDYSFNFNLSFSSKQTRQQKIELELSLIKYKISQEKYNSLLKKEKKVLISLFENINILKEQKKGLLDRVNYAETLYNEELKFFSIGRSTPLLLEKANYNFELRKNDLIKVNEEIYSIKLKILWYRGYDLFSIIID